MKTSGVTSASELLTDLHRRQYVEDGYFVLESAIAPDDLQLLRNEAEWVVRDLQGKAPPGKREQRFVYEHTWRERPSLRKFLFGDLMAAICRATIGDEAYLFYEQFVIKAAENGKGFSWHQDSGYIGPNHKPYVTCWCALDDVSEANGTVRILPQSISGIRTFVKHVRDERLNDMVGYFGKEPGIPAIVSAGSVVVFSSFTFHTSGPNTTDRLRRAYIAQFAPEIVHNAQNQPCGTAEPFLKGGRNIARIIE